MKNEQAEQRPKGGKKVLTNELAKKNQTSEWKN